MEIIQVERLSKEYITYKRGSTFGETVKSLFRREKVIVRAVDDISFTIHAGEVVGILGKNGAGKSTTIKMLTGVLFPTSGHIEALGFDPSRQRSKYVMNIGAVFGQKSQLIWDIPPADSFAMNKAIYGISDADYKHTLDEMTEAFEVAEIIKRPTRVLSLGERMKCEFIMAMLHRPKIVFLDEPTIGLDIIAKETIRGFVRRENEKGTTFILTTHDLADIEQLAHRVIIINGGKIVFDDSLTALKTHLGNKHILHISAKTLLPEFNWPGVEAMEKTSECEARLLINNGILSMSEMISRLGNVTGITEVSIETLSVTEIVRSIYST